MNIKAAYKYLFHYLFTYPKQKSWETYGRETWVNDVLYGLGVSLGHTDEESSKDIDGNPYRYASGFDNFKMELLEQFDNEGLLEKYLEEKNSK